MRAAPWLLVAVLSIACASKRERRQSAYTAQMAKGTQHDTAWYTHQWRTQAVQLVAVEEWSDTATDGGYTIPSGGNYRRIRSITFRTDSNTMASARSSLTDTVHTVSVGGSTTTSRRKTVTPIRYIGWLLAVTLLAVLVYRAFRRVNR